MNYEKDGKTFEFGDAVEVTCTLLPEHETMGRLVQVRKGVGQFGSDVYFVRLPNKRLVTFENVGLNHSFRDLPVFDGDSPEIEYTIKNEFIECGFVIEHPLQPQSESPMFGITVTKG